MHLQSILIFIFNLVLNIIINTIKLFLAEPGGILSMYQRPFHIEILEIEGLTLRDNLPREIPNNLSNMGFKGRTPLTGFDIISPGSDDISLVVFGVDKICFLLVEE